MRIRVLSSVMVVRDRAIHCYKTTAGRKTSRVTFACMMLRAALAVVLALCAIGADAQSGRKQDYGRDRQMSRERPMSQEDRQRMREDVRDAYRGPQQGAQKTRQQMSPEERGRLRRDIEDANKDLRR